MRKTFAINVTLLLLTVLVHFPSFSQEEEPKEEKPSNWVMNGYLKYLQTVSYENINGEWLTNNIIHNRMNFKWYASNSLTAVAEFRNRIFYGETVKTIPGYADIIARDYGYMDLSFNWVEQESFFIHTIVDRVYLDWSQGNWQVRVGRQRINWGQTYVWNPNDVFNAYDFFDFDYEERPGSDAALIRYYTGATSSVEFAYALGDSAEATKAVGMLKINKGGYDFQFLGGRVAQDVALGLGWSGQIKTAGFKGEFTFLRPYQNYSQEFWTMVASMSLDYTFKNSLFIQTEAIYNSDGATGAPGQISLFQPLSVRTLSFTRINWLTQASYPITPLITAGAATMYSPNDNSFFFGPNVDISITENFYFLLTGQIFKGTEESQYGPGGTFLFGRFKWSF
ncbi:hypothetical protein [Flexithrix dorotheae]|uniref:hypothetical protein n=1 Tax=Flexithrix dorotheae TaxID=70993 RepID=UPI000364F34A|nr:hypothetical protein [Flexithrix dorotheae]